MAAPARVHVSAERFGETPGSEIRRPGPGLATGAEHPAASPALMLQQALSAQLDRNPEPKWHPAATLAFVVGTCGAFWTVVGFGVANLVH